jgi:hypothetical protein
MRPRGSVGQPGLTILAVAGQPLVGGGPRHPKASAAWAGGQPSSVMRWTNSSRPNSVSRALAWAMRVPSRLGVSTAQADRGNPQLSTTLTGTTPSAAFRALVKRAGLPAGIHPHTMRHAVASFLADDGEPATVIASQLGHRDGGALAQRTYIHALPEAAARVASRLEETLGVKPERIRTSG